MTPETKVKNAWRKEAKKLGLEVIRFAFMKGVTTGWPDDLFLTPGGRGLFLEYKAPGAVPTPLQTYRAGLLWELGYDVCWTDSSDAARRTLLSRMGAAPVHAAGRGPSGGAACWWTGA